MALFALSLRGLVRTFYFHVCPQVDIDKDCTNGKISLMMGKRKKLYTGNIDMKLNFNHFLILKSSKFDPFYHFFF